jgi:ATP-binding cassette subfamily C protein LapB
VDRVVVIDAGRIVMDGPKAKVLAALSGTKPAAAAAAPAAPARTGTHDALPSNVHRHPATQPLQRGSAV